MKNIRVFFNRDKESQPPEEVVSPKRSPNSPDTRSDLGKLMAEVNKRSFTPEESTEEKERILSLLENLEFDDRLRDVIDAIVDKQYVPKELIEAGQRAMKSEQSIFSKLFENFHRMTSEDQISLVNSLLGGSLEQALVKLPNTIIEVPTKDGSVKKISGNMFLASLPQSVQQILPVKK